MLGHKAPVGSPHAAITGLLFHPVPCQQRPHSFTKSPNYLGWKGPGRSSGSTSCFLFSPPSAAVWQHGSCAWHPAPPASWALGTMGPGSSSEGRHCYFQRDARLPDSGWHGQQIGLGRGYFCIALPPPPQHRLISTCSPDQRGVADQKPRNKARSQQTADVSACVRLPHVSAWDYVPWHDDLM